MKTYQEMTLAERQAEYAALCRTHQEQKALGLDLNMARGKPGREQLDMVMEMYNIPLTADDFITDGIDARNYGYVAGIPIARRLFADLLGCKPGQVIAGGNSSLEMMFDAVSKAYTHGLLHSEKPWGKLDRVKWICPVPGYDRHFKVTESFGMELLSVPMTETGPDMDRVEQLIRDPEVRGMWNVPKYSNPTGITYSLETIHRLAAMKPAAPDFMLMWDNAYCVHELEGDFVPFPDILSLCAEYGNGDMVYEFASTSKITFPGAGIACGAVSEANVEYFKNLLNIQIISYDKMNQLRHVRYLKDKETPGPDAASCGHSGAQVPGRGGRAGPPPGPLGHRQLEPPQGRLFRQSGRHARHRQAGAGAVPGRRGHHDRRRGYLPLRRGPPGQQHPHCPLPAAGPRDGAGHRHSVRLPAHGGPGKAGYLNPPYAKNGRTLRGAAEARQPYERSTLKKDGASHEQESACQRCPTAPAITSAT